MNSNLSREEVWGSEVWDRIDQAVNEEVERTRIARRFIPLHGPVPEDTLTVPSNVFDPVTGTWTATGCMRALESRILNR